MKPPYDGPWTAGLADELGRADRSANLWPLKRAIAHLTAFVDETGGRVGKSVALRLDGPPVMVPARVVDAVVPVLVQLLRNAIAHGIEPPLERIRAGKPITSELRIAIASENDDLVVTVTDDGAGALSFNSVLWGRNAAIRESGLRRARGRVASIGGRVAIGSILARGTDVSLYLPMAKNGIRFSETRGLAHAGQGSFA